jgi:hypothetical protein
LSGIGDEVNGLSNGLFDNDSRRDLVAANPGAGSDNVVWIGSRPPEPVIGDVNNATKAQFAAGVALPTVLDDSTTQIGVIAEEGTRRSTCSVPSPTSRTPTSTTTGRRMTSTPTTTTTAFPTRRTTATSR